MVVTPKVQWSQIKYQYYASIAANLVMMGHGCGVGWLSPALPLLQSEDTPLQSGPLTIDQVSLTGSILNLGGITGNIIYGYILNHFGTKIAIATFFIPQMLAWLFMLFGTMAYDLYLSRFLVGIAGGGVQICVPLFVAEIANNAIRGRLGTIFQFTRNAGILMAYVLGAYFNYITSSMAFIGVTVLFFLSFAFLPSTPQYLLKIGREEQALKSLKFYRACHDKEDTITCIDEFDRLKQVAKDSKEETRISLKDFCEPKSRRGIFIAAFLPFLNATCGSYAFITYAANIFAKSGTHLNPNTSAIILALVQMSGTFVTAHLIDTQGRKLLMIISLSGCTIGHLSLAMYLLGDASGYDVTMFSWTPVTSMAFVILAASIGVIPLTQICLVEVLPLKLRSFGLTLATININIFNFLVIHFFPILTERIELYGCIFIFAFTCFIGLIFIIISMDETKGKELNVLHEGEKNKTNSAA